MHLDQGEVKAEFLRQMADLCAAYDKPVGDKAEVFWKAFGEKVRVSEFARIVEFCRSKDAPEKFPTVPQLWALRRKLRVGGGSQVDGNVVLEQLTRYVLQNYPLSAYQVGAEHWSFIRGDGDVVLGVIVPQDQADPIKYPAVRVLASDLPRDLIPAPKHDDIHCLAQRVMLSWLVDVFMRRGRKPISEAEMAEVIKRKQYVTTAYRMHRDEHDPEVDERWFGRQFRSAADKVIGFEREAAHV